VFIDIPIKSPINDFRAQRFLRVFDELQRIVKDDGKIVFIDSLLVSCTRVITHLDSFIDYCKTSGCNPSETAYRLVTNNISKQDSDDFSIDCKIVEKPVRRTKMIDFKQSFKEKDERLHQYKLEILHKYDPEYDTILDLCECSEKICLAAAQSNYESIGICSGQYFRNSRAQLYYLENENKRILPFRVVRYSNGTWAVKTDNDPKNSDILIELNRGEVFDRREFAYNNALWCATKAEILKQTSKWQPSNN